MARNLLLRYSHENDLVLDQMVGGGTTLVEAKLLGRRGVGVDVNPAALNLTASRLEFDSHKSREQKLFLGDARNLSQIPDGVMDFSLTHPPYWSIIRYSDGRIAEDLSSQESLDQFVASMQLVAREALRVLKPNAHCAILIGDTRRQGHFVPISWLVMNAFLQAGFILRENVIKLQWNVTSERERWTEEKYSFYKIAHEHLFVFRKPLHDEDRRRHLLSCGEITAPSNDFHSSPRKDLGLHQPTFDREPTTNVTTPAASP